MDEESNADQEMNSVTPYSNWELLSPNDNPNDRFNCFITTAAGLLGLNSVKEFSIKLNLSQYVRNALTANEELNIDRNRGAYLDEVKQFYNDLGIYYINEFSSKNDIMTYFENNVGKGEKKKFALGYQYDEEMKRLLESSIGSGIKTESLGHIVALKIDKSRETNIFRIIDFQLPRDHQNRLVKDDLPPHSKPPFHLFKKLRY